MLIAFLYGSTRHILTTTTTVWWFGWKIVTSQSKEKAQSWLLKTGNLVLTGAGRITVWVTGTASLSLLKLHLHNSSNMALRDPDGVVLWQSFDSLTDTIFTYQPLTRNEKLVSSSSQSNFSSSFYKLFFDNDNVLRLIFDDIMLSSVYWPSPWVLSWDVGRPPTITVSLLVSIPSVISIHPIGSTLCLMIMVQELIEGWCSIMMVTSAYIAGKI